MCDTHPAAELSSVNPSSPHLFLAVQTNVVCSAGHKETKVNRWNSTLEGGEFLRSLTVFSLEHSVLSFFKCLVFRLYSMVTNISEVVLFGS